MRHNPMNGREMRSSGVMNDIIMNLQSNISSFMMLLSGMQWSDYLDIICVAFLLFTLIPMIQSSLEGTLRVSLGQA